LYHEVQLFVPAMCSTLHSQSSTHNPFTIGARNPPGQAETGNSKECMGTLSKAVLAKNSQLATNCSVEVHSSSSTGA
jgi:hypothetical protein